MISEERVIRTEKIYEGKVVTLRCSTVELEGQRYGKREIVEHAGGACMVALCEDEKIPFVKQYRIAVKKELLELPAGLIGHNENPMDAAIRELSEETGLIADSAEFLLEAYTSPGFTNEKIHIFYCENPKQGEMHLDETEDLEVVYLDLDEAMRKIKLGEIIDAKTVIGICFVKEMREKHAKND
ncbi:ADP-ribose pyrophosphatase [Aedoeadaptatus ivorii]|uniref:ADP-ribose pyrophosphatase n=1 Tax=Aedoeadaptatus ivorii TaxID=54006 RepID=A0A448V1B0_9FIRM|nr:NUDIX hydrolase [Peptoniphilus ivorii]MDQ0507754.1 ADP-ribose pyrophosphatase [Peptoniphilus ivorii]VEJ35545.1 ADP-ribose pyrophosphatase [Peptoniphilus ivorii]